jgi:hypothetical protein
MNRIYPKRFSIREGLHPRVGRQPPWDEAPRDLREALFMKAVDQIAFLGGWQEAEQAVLRCLERLDLPRADSSRARVLKAFLDGPWHEVYDILEAMSHLPVGRSDRRRYWLLVEETMESFGMGWQVDLEAVPPRIIRRFDPSLAAAVASAHDAVAGRYAPAEAALREAIAELAKRDGDMKAAARHGIDALESVSVTLFPGSDTFGRTFQALEIRTGPDLVGVCRALWKFTCERVRHGGPAPTVVTRPEAEFSVLTSAGLIRLLVDTCGSGP